MQQDELFFAPFSQLRGESISEFSEVVIYDASEMQLFRDNINCIFMLAEQVTECRFLQDLGDRAVINDGVGFSDDASFFLIQGCFQVRFSSQAAVLAVHTRVFECLHGVGHRVTSAQQILQAPCILGILQSGEFARLGGFGLLHAEDEVFLKLLLLAEVFSLFLVGLNLGLV